MTIGSPQRTKPSYCLECHKILDGTACVEEEASPEPDDITICMYCGNVMAFGDDLRLRSLNQDETIMVADDPVIQKLLGNIHKNPLFAKNNRH